MKEKLQVMVEQLVNTKPPNSNFESHFHSKRFFPLLFAFDQNQSIIRKCVIWLCHSAKPSKNDTQIQLPESSKCADESLFL